VVGGGLLLAEEEHVERPDVAVAVGQLQGGLVVEAVVVEAHKVGGHPERVGQPQRQAARGDAGEHLDEPLPRRSRHQHPGLRHLRPLTATAASTTSDSSVGCLKRRKDDRSRPRLSLA
jgi:hypothetical protein